MLVDIKYLENLKVVVKAIGKLDIYTTSDYLDEVKKNIKFAKVLVLDFANITYIASIGLRAILELYKIMKDKDADMIVKNVCADVMNVFKTAGFDSFLNIENDTKQD